MVVKSGEDRQFRNLDSSRSKQTPVDRTWIVSQDYVRSQDELALYGPGATGRRMSGWEACKSFGYDKLEEALEFGSAILISDAKEPAATIANRRRQLSVSIEDVAKYSGLRLNEVQESERQDSRVPIRNLEKIARSIGLDENDVGVRPVGTSAEALALRLRRMRVGPSRFSANVVLKLGEAAWIINKQALLARWLDSDVNLSGIGFVGDPRYRTPTHPAWQIGYDLAGETRRLLKIGPTEPIQSLRRLVEMRLGIPLIHLELPNGIAGATVATGTARGIALNIEGDNRNVWVRRSTIAHELGHLLWDPDQSLEALKVDSFDALNRGPFQEQDFVEARANAFAVELLAPQEAVREVFRSHADWTAGPEKIKAGVRSVMEHFGISFTSAKFQIWNAIGRTEPLESFAVKDVRPTDDWAGRESFTNDFFQPKSVPLARRGLFASLVARCWRAGRLSSDSAASFLNCSSSEFEENAENIENMFLDA